MAWPTVTAGTPMVASAFNALSASIASWQGNVVSNSFSLSIGGTLTVTGSTVLNGQISQLLLSSTASNQYQLSPSATSLSVNYYTGSAWATAITVAATTGVTTHITPNIFNGNVTINSAVISIPTPANIAWGAFTSYTPTVSGGTMTSAIQAGSYSGYLQLGSIVILDVELNLNLAGAPTSALTISVPVGAASGRTMALSVVSNSTSLFALASISGNSITVKQATGANFPLGTITIYVSGCYRSA